MTVEMLTREQAEAERVRLLSTLSGLEGTTDRDELRDLDMRGLLTGDALAASERLRTLDFLLDG